MASSSGSMEFGDGSTGTDGRAVGLKDGSDLADGAGVGDGTVVAVGEGEGRGLVDGLDGADGAGAIAGDADGSSA